MEVLADYFEIVEPRIDSSIAFRSVRRIPSSALDAAIGAMASFDRRVALVDSAIDRLPAADRDQVRLVRAYLIGANRGGEALRQELELLQPMRDVADARWARNFAELLEHSYLHDTAESSDRVAAGWHAHDTGDYQRACELAERCLAGRARPVAALELRFEIAMRAGELHIAEQMFEEAVARYPRMRHRRLRLARLMLARGETALAEAEALAALRGGGLDADSVRYYLELCGECWLARDGVAQAVDVLNELDALYAESPDLWIMLARAHAVLGSREASLASLRRALAVHPGHAVAARLLQEWGGE
jgi:predicted Zn-dependent protease